MHSATIEAYGRLRAAFELHEAEAVMMPNRLDGYVTVDAAALGMVLNAFRDQDRLDQLQQYASDYEAAYQQLHADIAAQLAKG